MNVYLYTKDQLLKILSAWGVDPIAPRLAEKTYVVFPPSAQFNTAKITVHNMKSTYGKILYRVHLFNK